MIKNMKIRNFYGIRELQEFSFQINKKDKLDDSSYITESGIILNTVNVILGHNASGKTTILKALHFLNWFASTSYHSMKNEEAITYEMHELAKSTTSYFEVEFEQNNSFYKYIIELTKNEVLYEYLGVKKLRDYSYIYKYDWRDKRNEKIDTQFIPSFNKSDKERFLSKPNITLYSFLLNTGYLSSFNFNDLFGNFSSNVSNFGKVTNHFFQDFLVISRNFNENKEMLDSALKYLKEFDKGISDIAIQDIEINPDDISNESEIHPMLILEHKTSNENFVLNLLEESNGTQKFLNVLQKVIPILESGGFVVFDEIESSLHPLTAKKIVSLFENKKTNPHHAQIFFSTHQPWLLENRTKTQIFLTEKSDQLSSTIFRLDEIDGVRNDENFCAKYMMGEYGAIGFER